MVEKRDAEELSRVTKAIGNGDVFFTDALVMSTGVVMRNHYRAGHVRDGADEDLPWSDGAT